MTDQASIQSKIWRGYAKAAQKLGLSYAHYRPLTALNPISAPNQLPALFASFSPDGGYKKPSGYGKPLWQCLADGAQLRVGDYLAGGSTYFVAAVQPLLPVLAVECNRTASLYRVGNDPTAGAQGYGGMTAANEVAYATAFPCSILQGTKGEKNDAGLPADTRLPWWTFLLPAAAGTVRYGDLITDDLGNRYVASSVELTDLGYRITAAQVTV